MRLLWITDPHFDFLDDAEGAAESFGRALVQEHEFDAVVITGDLSVAPLLKRHVEEFALGVHPRRVSFTLGNHDYYHGPVIDGDKEGITFPGRAVNRIDSIESVKHIAGSLDCATWLDAEAPIVLDESTVLVGQGGWYDARAADPVKSKLNMTDDFMLISDLKLVTSQELRERYRTPIIEKLRLLGDEEAAKGREKLLAALKLRRDVIFATHYPPFRDACIYKGRIDNDWAPWFTCVAMGDMLAEVAAAHPANRILVICGHTHYPNTYEHAPNLKVLNGTSQYRHPRVSKLFELPFGKKLPDMTPPDPPPRPPPRSLFDED